MAKKRSKKPAKMTIKQIRALIDEVADGYETEMRGCDGHEDCCLGLLERFGQNPILVYDRSKILAKLAKDMGMDAAREYFDFNIIGAWMGEGTPAFLTPLEDL